MFGSRSKKLSTKTAPGQITLSIDHTVRSYTDAALVVTAEAAVIAANDLAQPFVSMLEFENDGPVPSLVKATLESNSAQTERLMIRAEDETLVFQINALPIQDENAEPAVLLLARDMTADRNIVDALVASRELFKDLVACSSDFAWETDEHGQFTYVSRDGALGFTPTNLVGKRARVLHDASEDRLFPFDTHQPLEDHELWLKDANGGRAFCRVSSKPVFKDGTLIAVRGVCRDITEEHEQQAELERRRMREKLLQRIVDALRTEFDSARLLKTAATLPTQVLNADYCWVFMADDQDALEISVHYPEKNNTLALVAEELVKRATNLDELVLPVEAAAHDRSLIADVTKFRGKINGAIVMARSADQPNWTEDERQLVASVAAHLGIAFHQIKERQILETLSRMDEVTGLKNRRAFMEELDQRLSHARRYNRTGVLAYVDLDNFKGVNDTLGHRMGDEVLKSVAHILENGKRAGDIPARLGGDEFVMWLEETGEEGGIKWAHRVLTDCESLRKITTDRTPPVTASIGLAVFDPAFSPDMEALLARADAAMYKAKRAGKASYEVAPLTDEETPETKDT